MTDVKTKTTEYDYYPEHGHTWIVKFYSIVPPSLKLRGYTKEKVLHRQFGPFTTKEQAVAFAKSYVKGYTVKGFIKGWELLPVCTPLPNLDSPQAKAL